MLVIGEGEQSWRSYPPLCSTAEAPIARPAQAAIPSGYTQICVTRTNMDMLACSCQGSLNTNCPSVLHAAPTSLHWTHFILCLCECMPLHTTKTWNLQFSLKGLLSLFSSSSCHLSLSPNLVLFSSRLTLIFPLWSAFVSVKKYQIPRLVIACLLANTSVAVNVVVWDREESHALWPVWHNTPSTAPLLQI